MAYYALGKKPQSDAALADLIQRHEKTAAYTIAGTLAYRGETDRAFAWLDMAFQRSDTLLGSIAVWPMFASIHRDPRWSPFLRKHGIAPEQLAAKFDVKLPQ